ncbi:MAG: DUF5989 family protein [Acidimicrobiales bacterium]
MLRLRHSLRLVRDLTGFALVNRVWWLLPLMVVLATITIFIVVGQVAAPYTLYTVF